MTGWPMRVGAAALAVLGALIGSPATSRADPTPQATRPRATRPCADFGAVRQVCGLGSPEDLARLDGTPWLIVSEQAPAAGESGLKALDTRTLKVVALARGEPPVSAPGCAAPQARVALGGLGVRPAPSGWRLALIRHGPQDDVQLYAVTMGPDGPGLSWTGCVAAPAPLFLNDIAPLPGGGLAATHMYDRAVAALDSKAQTLRYLHGEATGYVVVWSPAAGWAKVPGSEGAFPNGIDASADGRTLYFAETYGHRVNAIGLDGAGRRSIAVAMQPDNVTTSADGSVLVAGGTGAPVTSTEGCGAFRPTGCGFPSAVLRLNFATGAATPLFADDGGRVPGASVAVEAQGAIYVGTSFGDRVTVVPVARP